MGSTSTTTQSNSPYAPAQPLIDQGLADVRRMYESGGFNISPYQGPMVAGFSGMQQAQQAMTPGVVNNALGSLGASQQAVNRAMDPNAQSAGFDQVRQNTIANIMPGINASFAGSGMTGSTLHQQNLAKGLAAGLGGVENQNYQQGQNRALQAAQFAPQLNNAAFNALDYMGGVGQQQQMLNQAQIEADALRDQQGKTAEMDALQNFLALSTGAGSQFGVQSSTSRQSPGLMSMLGLGLQSAPFIFSDRRLKENIKRVGQTDGGLPIYTYNYIGNPMVCMGVMADEVEAVKPEAVGEIDGYKAVNYGAL